MGGKSKFDIAIADLVRQKRIEKNLTQDMIGAFIGANRSYISHIENYENRHKYNLKHLNILAEAMDCSPREFIPLHPIPEVESIKPQKKKPARKKKS